MAEPENVVAKLIVNAGIGAAPPGNQTTTWPTTTHKMPDSPPNFLTVYDTGGTLFGRVQQTGETQRIHSVQVRIRATKPDQGKVKGRAIESLFDSVMQAQVVVGAETVTVQGVHITAPLTAIGTEEQSDATIFTINAKVSY